MKSLFPIPTNTKAMMEMFTISIGGFSGGVDLGPQPPINIFVLEVVRHRTTQEVKTGEKLVGLGKTDTVKYVRLNWGLI